MEKDAMWIALAIWGLKELYATYKDDKRRNTDAVMTNTTAIIELRTKIEYLTAQLLEIPKLKADVNALHQKIRERFPLEKDINRPPT